MTRHDDTTRLRHMLDILWTIIQSDLPPLIAELRRILSP